MEKNTVTIIADDEFYEDFTCECGNDVISDGFYPCTKEGEQIEPNEGEWFGYYVCARCERIYLPEENVELSKKA